MLLRCFVIPLGLLCISIKRLNSSWIDPDTDISKQRLKSYTDGEYYDLVMSDEFNRDGRQFKDGYDPMWTGVDKSDDDQTSAGRKSLHFYNYTQIKTEDGKLVIETTTEDTKWKGWNPYKKKYEQMSRHFKSGMLQSWNKFCYTGGILEVDIQFPGRHDIGGLWPAVWIMGNLGRATFLESTNLMWPWSHPTCDKDQQRAQEISGCDKTTHYSLHSGKGRGATEIDIIEVMPGPAGKLPIVKNNVQRPYNSMTLQIAPGIPATQKRPFSGTLPEWGFTWYKNLTYGTNTSINPFFYGTYLAETKTAEPIGRSAKEAYQADALSSMMTIDKSYFDRMHTFRLEWVPGDNGYIHWYADEKFRFGIEQESLKEYGTEIPKEPSYVILNTAVSNSWGFPNPPWGCTEYDCKRVETRCGFNPGFCATLPAKMYVDSVRVYQNKGDPAQTVSCNPVEYPTKKWILAHEYRYKNKNEAHALKDIVTGGGSCKEDAECGEGYCSFRRCFCNKGWQGPQCLVPAYKDDTPDWETSNWIPFSVPYIPNFLVLCALLLGLTLIVSAIVFRRWKHEKEHHGLHKLWANHHDDYSPASTSSDNSYNSPNHVYSGSSSSGSSGGKSMSYQYSPVQRNHNEQQHY